MSNRARLIQTCVAGASLLGAALISTSALAQQGCCEGGSATGANAWTTGNTTDQTPANIAGATARPPRDEIFTPVAVEPRAPLVKAPIMPGWWSHGEIEFGLRGFVNDPQRDGSIFGDPGGVYTYLGQHALGKYYEYSTIAPGAFGGGHISTGTRDGLYQADVWANNIGYSDQAYLLSLSKIGEQYFQFSWDQTPHVYSTNAQTPYLGVGTPALTLPPALLSNVATSSSIIVPFLHQTDVKIERDTAAASYRWTPTEAWDIGADYSHLERTGTQPAGVVGFTPAPPNIFSSPSQVPAPVNDTTQNFGANGEYAGISPWNQRFTFKVAYNGSLYNDNMQNYTVQNPYCTGATAATCSFTALSPFARISTPPSNSANAVTGTLAADLPWQSRYVGTFNFTEMRQDQTFQPMTDNPSAVASPVAFFGGVPWNTVNFGFINGDPANPTNNLGGKIDTILNNNVLTTQITPTLASKLTYRYYGFDNDTPRIVFPAWVSFDQTGAFDTTVSNLSPGYIKQNAGAELNWRPTPQWNINGGAGWEHYNYSQFDVDATNEYSLKLSTDWKPVSWFTARASGYYADRRFDNYNYNLFVSNYQFPTVPGFAPTTSSAWFYAPAYRQLMFDNRERTKANIAFDIVAFHGVTISPTYKYQDDFYGLNPAIEEGLTNSRSNSWGVDVATVVNPDLSFLVSYYWEDYNQSVYNYTQVFSGGGFQAAPGNCTTGALANCLITTSDKTHVNTATAVVNYAAIPNKLNFDGRYAVSWGVDQQRLLTAATAAGGCSNCIGQFPNDTTLFQRLDLTATYTFDPMWISQWGMKSTNLKAKLRYTWERNSVNNWQNNPLAPFFPVLPTSIWLAYDNPNYNVQMIAASLIASW